MKMMIMLVLTISGLATARPGAAIAAVMNLASASLSMKYLDLALVT